MNIADLKNKNTILKGQIQQVLLRELNMIFEEVGECQLDISHPPLLHSCGKPFFVTVSKPSSRYQHRVSITPLDECSLEEQLFALKRLPVGIKRLKRKLAKDNKSAATVLDLYSQNLHSFILPTLLRNKVFTGVFWTLWFAACSIWSRILF